MRLTTREAAAYLGISVSYLTNMRNLDYAHEGPECYAVEHYSGVAYEYPIAGLDAWKAKRPKRGAKAKYGPQYLKKIKALQAAGLAAEEILEYLNMKKTSYYAILKKGTAA